MDIILKSSIKCYEIENKTIKQYVIWTKCVPRRFYTQLRNI